MPPAASSRAWSSTWAVPAAVAAAPLTTRTIGSPRMSSAAAYCSSRSSSIGGDRAAAAPSLSSRGNACRISSSFAAAAARSRWHPPSATALFWPVLPNTLAAASCRCPHRYRHFYKIPNSSHQKKNFCKNKTQLVLVFLPATYATAMQRNQWSRLSKEVSR